jgi:hypothetical protein
MSVKLVQKLKRRQKKMQTSIRGRMLEKIDARAETLSDSPGASKALLKVQRKLDKAFGQDCVGHEPELSQKALCPSMERKDYGGSDFGIALMLPLAQQAVVGVAQVVEITAVADVAGSLDSTHFLISSPSTDYYVWLNVDAGGTDPEVAGRTGIEVAISEGDSAADVATAVAAALDAESDFSAGAVGALITATCAAEGAASAPGAGDSGFTVSLETAGVDEVDAKAVELSVIVGDVVLIQSGELAGHYLKAVERISEEELRLEDVASFDDDTDVHAKFLLSAPKPSFV